jgi:hypothetical protein
MSWLVLAWLVLPWQFGQSIRDCRAHDLGPSLLSFLQAVRGLVLARWTEGGAVNVTDMTSRRPLTVR